MPSRFDDAAPRSRDAGRDRKLLESCDDPNVLAGAAHALDQMLGTRGFPSTRAPEIRGLIVALFTRADSLDPGSFRWKNDLAMAYQNWGRAASNTRGKIAFYEKSLAAAPVTGAPPPAAEARPVPSSSTYTR